MTVGSFCAGRAGVAVRNAERANARPASATWPPPALTWCSALANAGLRTRSLTLAQAPANRDRPERRREEIVSSRDDTSPNAVHVSSCVERTAREKNLFRAAVGVLRDERFENRENFFLLAARQFGSGFKKLAHLAPRRKHPFGARFTQEFLDRDAERFGDREKNIVLRGRSLTLDISNRRGLTGRAWRGHHGLSLKGRSIMSRPAGMNAGGFIAQMKIEGFSLRPWNRCGSDSGSSCIAFV